VKNESLLDAIKTLHNVKKEKHVDKQEVKRVNEKNAISKVDVHDYQMRETLLLWGFLLLVLQLLLRWRGE